MSKTKIKYGLTVEGVVRVFSKEKTIEGKNKKKFTITDVWFNVSEREEDGNYFNKPMNLVFKRGLYYPNNNTVIKLKGFPVIRGNGDYRQIAILVQEWEEIE